MREGQTITELEGDALLCGDMRIAAYVVNALVIVPLTQGQFDALVDFTYNAGQGSFRNSSLLRFVNAKEFEKRQLRSACGCTRVARLSRGW